ncbi:MAG: hypothetical protein GXO79_09210 [Chlorobi bacterium]|nr:hypothetical protein [Chlorobiota bacterium]
MRRILFTIFFFLWIPFLWAQNFENSWINYNQQYFKIPIVKSGIYKITSNELLNAGIPVSSFNPQNIQLYYKGAEQPIYVKEISSGILDYIEFYAEHNDGWLDSSLFVTPKEQTNPYYSLINDTATYYFTWNNSFSNKRLRSTNYSNFTEFEPQEYCLYDTVIQYTSKYYYGKTDPEYTSGEGWFDGAYFSLGNSIVKTISTPFLYTDGPNTVLEYAIAGFSSGNHHINVKVQSVLITDFIYSGYTGYKDTLTINTANLSNSNVFEFISIDDQSEATDNNTISFIHLKYPATFDFTGRKNVTFELASGTDSLQYIEFKGIDNQSAIVYNIKTQTRTISNFDNDKHQLIIPDSGSEDQIVVTAASAVLSVDSIQKMNFTNYTAEGLNEDFLIITNSLLWDEALQYASYRNAYLVNVEELYHQFAYGVRKHPLAIKNFVNYIYQNSEHKPSYLLLLGKGIQSHYIRNNADLSEDCLIPSYGNPASDNLFTAGLLNTVYEPLIPTGRVAAKGQAEVRYYLNKVKEYESQQPAAWMKQILHFGGGSSTSEQQTLASYLKVYENIIEDTLFGGTVSTFLKSSSAPIEITISDTIKNLINSGASMLTFFGHAAASGFDQNIDDPSAYENSGKYPFLLANSCYSGNIFLTTSESVSERWVLIPDKGVVGFLASTYLANAAELSVYSTILYQNIAYKNYHQSIGKCIQQTVIDFVGDNANNIIVKNTVLQFNLHGDPSIIINSQTLPDLQIDGLSFYTVPRELSTEIDSFNLYAIITNIGKAFVNGYMVELNRTFPDGSVEQYFKFPAKSFYKDTLIFKIPVNRVKGSGINKFEINIDANNVIDEFNELNNLFETNVFIKTNDLSPVYPYVQSIFPNDSVILKASTGDPFADLQNSVFQFDTTRLFNSQFLTETTLEHSGGIVEWQIPKKLDANQTYYWRASKIPDDGDYKWNSSSFQYIPGKNGWAQSRVEQINENDFSFIEYNSTNKHFEYITTPKQIHGHNIGLPSGDNDYKRIEYTIDGSGDYSACGAYQYMVVVVIDSLTITPWLSNRADYGHSDYPKCGSRSRPDKYFLFPSSNETGRANMANFINDSVPDGNYIMAYSFIRGNFSQWEDYPLQVFEDMGATEIRNVPDSFPYIFFTQKGYINSTLEKVGSVAYEEIDLYANMKNNFYYGEITTKKIGPSKGWKTLGWSQHSIDNPNTDSIRLIISGIGANNETTVLYGLGSNNSSFDLSQIDYKQYPYLQLRFFSQDIENKTPAQLDYWQIEYDGVSELAIDPSSHFIFFDDTVEQGENVNLQIAIRNISPYVSDSIKMKYWLYDKDLNYKLIDTSILAPVNADSYIIDTLIFSSLEFEDRNQLWMEINPSNGKAGYYQPEQFHFNNIAEKDFFVEPDKTNPILDVTFDGIHIMNDEIVSAKPEILITLSDENKYIPLNDTSLFTISLISFEEGEKRVYFNDNTGNEILSWVPANLPDNNFKIIYRPLFEKDGIYELKVKAKDVKGNYSGYFDYDIRFEIINKSTITNIYNYPNPFSTSTRFVFELTGSEIPDDLRIQILTVTGKFVKEINLTEVANIHIGKNITDYAWDGTDEYGDKLANGVYFYRVLSRLNGQSIEQRASGGDNFFTKGYGKMYIMR